MRPQVFKVSEVEFLKYKNDMIYISSLQTKKNNYYAWKAKSLNLDDKGNSIENKKVNIFIQMLLITIAKYYRKFTFPVVNEFIHKFDTISVTSWTARKASLSYA